MSKKIKLDTTEKENKEESVALSAGNHIYVECRLGLFYFIFAPYNQRGFKITSKPTYLYYFLK